MKRYLMLLCLLFTSFVVSSQTTTPDSLKSALQKATSERSRLEILTNLMDISRNDDILVNAKQLYQEALKANDNYYKEAALTEILRRYINTDQTDSANIYIAKAEQELKGEARASLVSFMKMIQDTRVIFYTSGEPRKKVLMNCLFKLEEPDKLSPYEKIACNYILGMAVSNSIMEENMLKEDFKQGREYFDNVLAEAEKLPLRYAYNFLPNTYFMLCAYASNPQERGQYATRYLNTILGYSNIPEMRKRPYAVNKRQLLSAYSNLAISAEAIGKDLATSYYRKFMNLLKAYPESASAAPEYELYYTSSNYYLGIKDYKKFIEFSDSLINFSKQIPLYKEHVIAYVSAKAAAYDSLRMYKEAYETSKEYAVLLDTLRMQELRKKMENLEQMEKALQNTTQILEETNQIDWTGILNLIHLTDMEKMLVEQYKNGENLNIRISLHEQYSQNKKGWFPWLLEQMDFDGARRILEIGCGNGQLWKKAEPSVLKGKYICLSDLSDGMIRDAAENLGEEKASCFDFRTLDCQKLPFPDAEYDRIIANHVLFYVQNLSRGLQEISRVLSDDGVFYCSTYGKGHMKEITDLVQEFDPQINLSEVALYTIFGLDHGEKQLKPYFGSVEKRIYEDSLWVDRPEPLLDYILSCHGNQNEYLYPRQREFKEFLEKKIQKHGGIAITKEAGVFICRK